MHSQADFLQPFSRSQEEEKQAKEEDANYQSTIPRTIKVAPTENRRTYASSRVNFSKLTTEEKEQRCLNLAKEVKELRRKLKNLSSTSQPKRLLCPLHTRCEQTCRDLDCFARAHLALQQANHAIEDQHSLLQNLCGLIASGRLPAHSLAFNKICTVVRALLSP